MSSEVSVADYTIERGLGVRERMDLLATVHAPATLTVLDMLGVALGARCVDLGCGGGHITMELARRVGPSGQVTGVDLDEALLGAARQEAAARGLDNVTFRVSPVEDLVETGVDLAFARMLLSHLRDPAGVLINADESAIDAARKELPKRAVSMAQDAGAKTGYWLAPQGGRGVSVVVFDSEDKATAQAEKMKPGQPTGTAPGVTFKTVEVREVLASF